MVRQITVLFSKFHHLKKKKKNDYGLLKNQVGDPGPSWPYCLITDASKKYSGDNYGVWHLPLESKWGKAHLVFVV